MPRLLPARSASRCLPQHQQNDRDAHHHQIVECRDLARDLGRHDQGRDTADAEDVGNVGADDIADCDTRRSDQRRLDVGD